MKTIILSLFTALCFGSTLHAQTPAANHAKSQAHIRIDPINNRLQYKGYTIQFILTAEGGFGYDITKGGQMILHQFHNPLPGNKPITKQEDVATVAKWVADQYIKTGKALTVLPQNIQQQLKLGTSN